MRCSKAPWSTRRSAAATSPSNIWRAPKRCWAARASNISASGAAPNGAVLEFENEIDGIRINGVDIITFGDDGKITHFKVMVRPLQGDQPAAPPDGRATRQQRGRMTPAPQRRKVDPDIACCTPWTSRNRIRSISGTHHRKISFQSHPPTLKPAPAGRTPCRSTKPPWKTSPSCSTTCSRSTATTICPALRDASADVREAILDEAAKLTEEVLQPLNRIGDLEGCKRHDDGRVTTPKGFKEAFKQVAEGGWLGLSAPAEYGGQGLPVTLSQVVTEFQSAANMAFSMYGGLTMGATAALMVHGKPEQKKMFVPKMVAGEWTGTMNLTEPQCGTDLGLLRTKAVKQADGSYKITGTKIFISAGEHDLDRQHHPSGAGAHRGRACRHQGRVAVRGAEGSGQCRRLAGRTQRRVLRLDRAQDGHPRQFHLRDELRQRHRLADRRGEQGHAGHVRDDERGPARRRRAGPRAVRSRLSERRQPMPASACRAAR